MKKTATLALLLAFLCAPAQASQISIKGAEGLKAGETRALTLRLTRDGQVPIAVEDLKTVHTKKLHLLVVDDSLSDYQHIHPQPGEGRGDWTFSFTPHTAHSYTVWADITPEKGEHEYIGTVLQGEEPCAAACIDKTVALEGAADGVKGALTLDGALQKGEMVMATLALADAAGQPVKDLEPVMGAFAHVVGFYAASPGVVHIHPMGDEPEKETDRGGPELMFHLEPAQAGTVKLFAQVKRGGKDIFLPFTLNVKP